MKEDYKRLLQAAKELRGWESPAEVSAGLAKFGYPVSEQTMTNWKTRGVSKEGRLKASAIIGCRPLWIESATGQMIDTPSTIEPGKQGFEADRAHRAAQPSGVYSLPVEGLLKRLAEAEAALPNFDLLAAAIDGLISYAFASSRAQSKDKPAAEGDSTPTQPPKSQPTGLRGKQLSSRAVIAEYHAGQDKTKKSK